MWAYKVRPPSLHPASCQGQRPTSLCRVERQGQGGAHCVGSPTRRGLSFVVLYHKTGMRRGQPATLVALGGKEPTRGQPLVVSKGKDEEGEPLVAFLRKEPTRRGQPPSLCCVER